jgi:hypothetical protein
VIHLPRKSVTRFFIPLIDVLILLFCIFLLMPFVSGPPAPELPPEAKDKVPEKPLPTDVKQLQDDLSEARLVISRLEKEKLAKLTDRLAVRVLEIDPTNGTLFYFDPGREEIKTDADAERLILKQMNVASKSGKDVFFLILYPRRLTGFPTSPQIEQIDRWFKNRPHGFDNPLRSNPEAP